MPLNIKDVKKEYIGVERTTAFFSLFSAWMLAVPFLGLTLHSRLIELNVELSPYIVTITVACQLLGLILAGYIVKSAEQIRKTVRWMLVVCAVGTVVFLFPFSAIWYIPIIVLPLVGGIVVACWGHYYKRYTTSDTKLQSAANVIILSNVGMIVINVIAVNFSPSLGIIISIAMLIASLALQKESDKLDIPKDGLYNTIHERRLKDCSTILYKPLILLYVFIAIITIDSGMMYEIVNPSYAHHEFLISFYWAIPYIGTIYIMKRLPSKVNRSYVLYFAVAMIGFAYILFYVLDDSAFSYVVIDTVMLGAFGICDIFWWLILGEMLAFTDKPVKIFGLGLSANVLGVLFGGIIGDYIIIDMSERINTTTVAISIVLASLLVLPILYDNLSRLIKNQSMLVDLFINEKEIEKEKDPVVIFGLTGREAEIAALLSQGRTYKMIAKELFISENTVKTHIRNIYSKMNVINKTEFIEMMKITQNQ